MKSHAISFHNVIGCTECFFFLLTNKVVIPFQGPFKLSLRSSVNCWSSHVAVSDVKEALRGERIRAKIADDHKMCLL